MKYKKDKTKMIRYNRIHNIEALLDINNSLNYYALGKDDKILLDLSKEFSFWLKELEDEVKTMENEIKKIKEEIV